MFRRGVKPVLEVMSHRNRSAMGGGLPRGGHDKYSTLLDGHHGADSQWMDGAKTEGGREGSDFALFPRAVYL